MTVPSDRKEAARPWREILNDICLDSLETPLTTLQAHRDGGQTSELFLEMLAVVERYENALRVQVEAVQRADKVFAAMIDFATVFVNDDPEGRIGVLSRRVIQHSVEARELIADAA